jgi:hypothetical protein
MRVIRLILAAVILFVAAPSFAQEWVEYYSRDDRFLVNFPKQPQVRTITYHTEYDLDLPAHVHSYEEGPSRYSVTVVDYSNVVKIHGDQVKGCTLYPDQCTNQGPNELRGALDYAVWNFLKRDAKITYYGYANSDRIEGAARAAHQSGQVKDLRLDLHAREPRLYHGGDGTRQRATARTL